MNIANIATNCSVDIQWLVEKQILIQRSKIKGKILNSNLIEEDK